MTSRSNFYLFTVAKSEEKKNRTKEEKQQLKAENEETVKEYGWCIIDGHKQRIGNFKIEPPGITKKEMLATVYLINSIIFLFQN